MKNLGTKKRYVIPGDVITTAPLRLDANVTLDGKRIMATCMGLSDVSSDSVRVIPLAGVYLPKIDDLVLCTISFVSGNSWFADMNSCYQGMLLGQDVFGRGSTKIPRLIGKHGSMIQTIEAATNATITVGQNGLVVVDCEESNGLLKAIAAIRMVEEQAHLVDLTNKVKKMLEFNGV